MRKDSLKTTAKFWTLLVKESDSFIVVVANAYGVSHYVILHRSIQVWKEVGLVHSCGVLSLIGSYGGDIEYLANGHSCCYGFVRWF